MESTGRKLSKLAKENESSHKDSSEENNFIHHRESSELSIVNFYPLLSNIQIYNIIFPNKAKDGNNKIIVFNRSIQKILKSANVDENDIFSFILFYINEINLEAIGENKDLYNINYNNLMNIINFVHINYKNNDIKIHKSSLKKIIDLCGLIREEKIKYMNFQGIEETKGDNPVVKNNLNNSISSDYSEEKNENKIIRPKKIIKNKKNKNKKPIKIIKGDINELINQKDPYLNEELNGLNKNLITNNRYHTNNINYILDSDEEDYESNLLERSYNILRSKNENNLNKIRNIYNDTKEDTYLNTLDNTFRNENTLSMSINENNNLNQSIPNLKLKGKNIKIKKKKKSKKNQTNQSFYKISSNSSFTYLSSTASLKRLNTNETETETDLIYPYNGYTKLSTSLSIENPIKNEKQKEFLNKKYDDDYCFYPFILRKTPDLKNKVLYLLGSIPKLGVWDPMRAIKMDEEERNGEQFFTKYIEIYKREIPFEYKYFYYDNEKIKWCGKPFQNYITFPQFFEYLRSLKKSHISIMNINIRYLNKTDGINIWKNRRNKLIELILNKTADIFLFQEITRTQSDYIDKYLSSIYEFVGDYRDSSLASEKCSICVNKLKYTIIHSGQFWLSSTPYVPGSNDFGNFFPRICTWASFKQIDGITLLFMNVHLDHANKNAHLPCIKIILNEENKIENKYKDIKFVFIGGCFYCEENDEEIKYIKSMGYSEIKFENTYHGFTGNAKNHWDYMFWKEKKGEDIELKDVYVLKKEATIDKRKNFYVSDHFPVYAEFYHKNKK